MTRRAFSLYAMTAMAVLSAALLSGAAKNNDVRGYSSGKNVWLLGAKQGGVSLAGFTKLDSGTPRLTAHSDVTRTIQYEGTDMEVTAVLVFKAKRLAAVVISVADADKPYASLRQYYATRLSGCTLLEDEAGHCTWSDDRDDELALIDLGEDYMHATDVIYVRGDALEAPAGGEMPDWLSRITKALG